MEGLQNPLRRPHPATGRRAALAFAVNSTALDRKIRLALHPIGGRGLTARVLQTFPMRRMAQRLLAVMRKRRSGHESIR